MGIFMLPNTHDLPAILCQSAIRIFVSASIGFDFLAPELGIRFGPSAMDRTTMPEATIYENSDLFLREQNIRSTRGVGDRASIRLVLQA